MVLQSIDLDLWEIIKGDLTFPSELIDGVMAPKPKQEWDECDWRNFQLNANAFYTLQCDMDRNEYNRICNANQLKKSEDYLK